MDPSGRRSVWELLHEYALAQTGTFTSREVISWFERHAPGQATEGTIRAHVRGAAWNVESRSQFENREPFLCRVGHGVFRPATSDEVASWRFRNPTRSEATPPLSSTPASAEIEWYSEQDTQQLLVGWLRRAGWTIVRAVDTATREPGVDVVAERGGHRLGVEVKGYPSPF